MVNIILDEKRMLKVGEVCAIELKNIMPVNFMLDTFDPEDVSVKFFPQNKSVSSDSEIIFIKYLGNGMFMDLVSDQLIISELYSADDIGTEEFDALSNEESRNELCKMKEQWSNLCSPKSIEDFKRSFSVFMENPFVVDVSESPFISIGSEVAIKFASQSLEQVKSKLISSKLMAQQEMQQEYNEIEDSIAEFYTTGTITPQKQM